jgi:hypothetical protein
MLQGPDADVAGFQLYPERPNCCKHARGWVCLLHPSSFILSRISPEQVKDPALAFGLYTKKTWRRWPKKPGQSC